MFKQTSARGLRVREHVRETVNLPIRLSICSEHCEQVRFTPTSKAATPNAIDGVAVDISSGGLGIESTQFLPHMTEGVIRVFPNAEDGTDPTHADPLFEQRVKVRRVRMVTHDPIYALGLSFVEPRGDLENRIKAAQDAARVTPHSEPSAGGPDDG